MNTQFRGVEKKRVFCVNSLEPDTTESSVSSDFLKEHGIKVFSCFVTKNNNTNSRFVSMRLCVSVADITRISDPDLWPSGVTVRPWTFKERTSL